MRNLRHHTPHGPYRLCGGSFGAVLAYEMARQLEHAGERVSLLALSDPWLSGFKRPLPVHRKALLHLRNLISKTPVRTLREVTHKVKHRLSAARADATPSPAARLAFRAYKPGRYSGKITLFKAVTESEVFFEWHPYNGFDRLCSDIEVHNVDASHFAMVDRSEVGKVAALLNQCLDRTAYDTDPQTAAEQASPVLAG